MTPNPGLYPDIDEAVYHADKGSLSVSGAKKLLPPSCPAKFKWERDNGQAPKREFDLGRAAHTKVLGVGGEVVAVQKTAKDGTRTDATDYQTKSAQEHRDAIRAEGKTPLLASEIARVAGMAAALRKHPMAAALFDPEHGEPEQSLYWIDPETGIVRRGRLDWLGTATTADGRLLVPDYKSCTSADRESVMKSVYNYRYFMQDAWYSDGVQALGLTEEAAFVFVFQETYAPYLVNVVQLDPLAKQLGRAKNWQALRTYAECSATDTWPGYSEDVEMISLPPWATTGLDAA